MCLNKLTTLSFYYRVEAIIDWVIDYCHHFKYTIYLHYPFVEVQWMSILQVQQHEQFPWKRQIETQGMSAMMSVFGPFAEKEKWFD